VSFAGTLEAIYIAGEAAAPLVRVDAARAIAGTGLDGDRYALGRGTFENPPLEDREVTLIEIETIEALARDGLTLEPGAARRNLVTRGVPLNHLVGVEFAIGDAVIRGRRLCEPCDHLAKLTSPTIMKALIHRGGMRAQIIVGAMLRVGDPIRSR
jgi:MOSC domain-containing protein YiiM